MTGEETTILSIAGTAIIAIIGLFAKKDFLNFLSKKSELVEHLQTELKEEKETNKILLQEKKQVEDEMKKLQNKFEKFIIKSRGNGKKT